MSFGMFLRCVGAVPILLFAPTLPASALPMLPESGAVRLEQVDFRGGHNSGVGEITAFFDETLAATGLSSGFLNVANSTGEWLVRNLPLIGTWDSNSSTTRFDLGISNGSTELTSMNVSVDFSPVPLASFTPLDVTFRDFSVFQTDFAAGGVEDTVNGFLPGPDLGAVAFGVGGLTFDFHQNGHRNVQAALNQCAPAAVANSLDFLRRTQGLRLPHRHRKGLRGDDTLVGQLDTAMDRPAPNRRSGSGRWPLDGKLKYIADADLDERLEIKHRGDGFTRGNPNVKLTGTEDLTRHGVTSHGQGATVTWEWILSELQSGEDVEVNLAYKSGGAHYVNVVGAGMILGVPYIRHISDHAQSDVDRRDRRGTDKVDFEFMIGDFVTHSNATIDQALSESVKPGVPEPSIVQLMVACLAGFAGRKATLQWKTRAAGRALDHPRQFQHPM